MWYCSELSELFTLKQYFKIVHDTLMINIMVMPSMPFFISLLSHHKRMS